MLNLQAFAQLADSYSSRIRANLDREESLILFRREPRAIGKHVFAEAKKFPHGVSERSECAVILHLKIRLHC
jgi:hypothetical protein